MTVAICAACLRTLIEHFKQPALKVIPAAEGEWLRRASNSTKGPESYWRLLSLLALSGTVRRSNPAWSSWFCHTVAANIIFNDIEVIHAVLLKLLCCVCPAQVQETRGNAELL